MPAEAAHSGKQTLRKAGRALVTIEVLFVLLRIAGPTLLSLGHNTSHTDSTQWSIAGETTDQASCVRLGNLRVWPDVVELRVGATVFTSTPGEDALAQACRGPFPVAIEMVFP